MKKTKSVGKFPVLWTVLTVLCVVLMIVGIVGNVIASQYASVINIFLGVETTKIVSTGEAGDSEYFKSDYESADELQKADYDVAERLTEEGVVLLKNENKSLPISSSAKVSVFGHASVDIVPCGY